MRKKKNKKRKKKANTPVASVLPLVWRVCASLPSDASQKHLLTIHTHTHAHTPVSGHTRCICSAAQNTHALARTLTAAACKRTHTRHIQISLACRGVQCIVREMRDGRRDELAMKRNAVSPSAVHPVSHTHTSVETHTWLKTTQKGSQTNSIINNDTSWQLLSWWIIDLIN